MGGGGARVRCGMPPTNPCATSRPRSACYLPSLLCVACACSSERRCAYEQGQLLHHNTAWALHAPDGNNQP